MSGTKFYLWGGGRWRELSPSGRISGWGRARFVAATGRRLERCRRRAVLRGLRALAAGAPTTVHDGPPLSQISSQVKEKADAKQKSQHCERCSCAHPPALGAVVAPVSTVHLSAEEIFNRLLNTATAAAAVRRGAAADVPPGDRERVETNQNYRRVLEPKRQSSAAEKDSPNVAACAKRKPGPSEGGTRAAKRARWGSEERETETRVEVCKELVIGEEDVVLLRRFVERHDSAPFPVDLLRYDEDDDYKRSVFFRLNPIVSVTRSRRVERMLRERRSRTREGSQVSLKDFASILGLQSVEERSSQETDVRRSRHAAPSKGTRVRRPAGSLAGDTDKENATESGARPARTARARPRPAAPVKHSAEASARDERTAKRRRTNTEQVNGKIAASRPRRANVEAEAPKGAAAVPPASAGTEAAGYRGGAREYSALEDAAIVRWVAGEGGGRGAGGGRARLVNGNRLWRELQPEHQRRTGHFRSWHSLRNRYLRSLLPRLALHVSAAEAARLRAAAATGELKSSKSRRNSIFGEARVRSAWLRRARSPPAARSPPRYTPTPPGARSSSTSSDASSERSRGSATPPRTRDRLRRTAAGEATRTLRSSAVTSPARALRARPPPTPTYSELTRRYASRSRSSSAPPAPLTPRTPRSPRPRTRRLYNANRPV